jgi:hypothetical protein
MRQIALFSQRIQLIVDAVSLELDLRRGQSGG